MRTEGLTFRLLKSFRMPFLANNFIYVFFYDFFYDLQICFFMVEKMTYEF